MVLVLLMLGRLRVEIGEDGVEVELCVGLTEFVHAWYVWHPLLLARTEGQVRVDVVHHRDTDTGRKKERLVEVVKVGKTIDSYRDLSSTERLKGLGVGRVTERGARLSVPRQKMAVLSDASRDDGGGGIAC